MAVSHSNCPGALSLQTYHRLQHQVHLLCTRLAHFSLHPRILGHRCPPKLAHLTTPQCPSHCSVRDVHPPGQGFPPCPLPHACNQLLDGVRDSTGVASQHGPAWWVPRIDGQGSGRLNEAPRTLQHCLGRDHNGLHGSPALGRGRQRGGSQDSWKEEEVAGSPCSHPASPQG